jgi:hypothetical protein
MTGQQIMNWCTRGSSSPNLRIYSIIIIIVIIIIIIIIIVLIAYTIGIQ